MAITRVSGGGSGLDYSGGGSSTIATSAFAHTTGDDIIGTIRHYDPADSISLVGVADTAGNTYIIGPTANVSAGGRVTVVYSLGAAGHASNVVTATFSTSAQYRSIAVNKYNGLTGGALDVGSGSPAAATGTSTGTNAVASSAFDTAQAEELVYISVTVGDNFAAWTPPANYLLGTDDGFGALATADRITSATLSGETITMGCDKTPAKVILVVSFTPAGGGMNRKLAYYYMQQQG